MTDDNYFITEEQLQSLEQAVKGRSTFKVIRILNDIKKEQLIPKEEVVIDENQSGGKENEESIKESSEESGETTVEGGESSKDS